MVLGLFEYQEVNKLDQDTVNYQQTAVDPTIFIHWYTFSKYNTSFNDQFNYLVLLGDNPVTLKFLQDIHNNLLQKLYAD